MINRAATVNSESGHGLGHENITVTGKEDMIM
jgi:hypothetical protein